MHRIALATGLVALGAFKAAAAASASVCERSPDASHLALGYAEQAASTLSEGVGRTRRQNHNLDLLVRINEDWAVGVGYRYGVLGLEPDALQTNGHLHTAFLPIHRQSGDRDDGFRLSVAPALSASSNIVKDPGEWSSDAFQLLAAAVWRRPVSEQAGLRYGLCADSRFGRYRVYPSVSFDWRPGLDTLLELGFPISRLSYQLTQQIATSLQVSPDGNEWHVRSADLARSSDLEFEATLLEWQLHWQPQDKLALIASVGRLYDGEYEATLPDGRRVSASDDDVTRLGIAIRWQF